MRARARFGELRGRGEGGGGYLMGEQDTSSSIETCGLSQPPAGPVWNGRSTAQDTQIASRQRGSHAWRLMQSALNECLQCMLVCAAVLSWSMWHTCEPHGTRLLVCQLMQPVVSRQV